MWNNKCYSGINSSNLWYKCIRSGYRYKYLVWKTFRSSPYGHS
ncbi:hypothetical protein IT399_03555 [Candidatus Nomurabacteria bacterium]|nr:hypothetical protein [Candidatus Nomurabacteria bacterium]